MSIRDWLIPQDKQFYNLFEQQAKVAKTASNHLIEMVEHFEDIENKYHKMKAYEHDADEVTHSIYDLLNRSFITPIEPEEITSLASAMDNIVDAIDDSARKMFFYDIKETDKYIVETAHIIDHQVDELLKAISMISDPKNDKNVDACCIEINRLENVADDVNAVALQNLFKTNDAVRILKMKDIYENLEETTDRCEDVANMLGDIIMKHS